MVYGIPLIQDDEFNAPGISYSNYARMPQWDNHTVVVAARRRNVGPALGSTSGTPGRTRCYRSRDFSRRDRQRCEAVPNGLDPSATLSSSIRGMIMASCTDVGIGNPTNSSTTTKIVQLTHSHPT